MALKLLKAIWHDMKDPQNGTGTTVQQSLVDGEIREHLDTIAILYFILDPALRDHLVYLEGSDLQSCRAAWQGVASACSEVMSGLCIPEMMT